MAWSILLYIQCDFNINYNNTNLTYSGFAYINFKFIKIIYQVGKQKGK